VNSWTNLAYGKFSGRIEALTSIIIVRNAHVCPSVYYAISTLDPHESLLSASALPNLALFFVGVMSLGFHLSLKYATQMCDDLSMFWVCAAIIFEIYGLDKSRNARAAIGLSLTSTLGIISVIHYRINQLWLHNSTFVLLVTAIWPRVVYLIRHKLKGQEKRDAIRTFRIGGTSFLLGFVLWLIDGAVCGWLRDVRGGIGLPWAFFLELHGWWHILTAVGAGIVIRLTKRLTKEDGKAGEGEKRQ